MHNKIFKFLVFFVLLFNIERVNASTLVKNKEENIFYERIGGAEGYYSAHFSSYTIDGKTTYCIEPGTRITSEEYISEDGLVNSPFSPLINEKLELIGYYGYDYPGHQNIRYRMATQALIWETIDSSFTVNFSTEKDGKGDKIDVSSEKEEILALVKAHNNLPSFVNGIIETKINEELKLTDNNSVISEFEVQDKKGANVDIHGDELIISNLKADIQSLVFSKKTYTKNKSVLFVGIDETTQTMAYFGLDHPTTFTLTFRVIGGQLTVYKKDKNTLSFSSSGDASLEGTTFYLYNEQKFFLGIINIDNNLTGKSTQYLNYGKYYISEHKAGKGYIIDPKFYSFEITPDNLNPEITVYNKPIESKLEIYKVLENNKSDLLIGEENITFDIYLKSNGQLIYSITTDKDGYASITLPYGTYIIKQRNSSLGYKKVDDFEITIDEKTEPKIIKILADELIKIKLRVKKIDAITKEIIHIDGIKFKIKNLDTNEYVCQNVTYPQNEQICTFETKNGIFTTPEELLPGHYQLEEIEDQIINGYKWNSSPLSFEIGNNENLLNIDGELYLELLFENTPIKGKISLTKLGEKVKYLNNTFAFEEILLDNVTYGLYALDDIYYNDLLIYSKDSLIGTYITENGQIIIDNLYLGNYYLKELKTIDNFILDEKTYPINLFNSNQYDAIVNIDIELKNYLIKGNINIVKKDNDNYYPLSGIEFEIHDANNNNLIFKGKTDAKGMIEIKNLYAGKFYLIETATLRNYVLNGNKKYFEIKNNMETISLTIYNQKIKGNLLLVKKDKETNEPLANTQINVYNTNDKLIYEGITNEMGEIYLSNLPYGDYYVKEINAPTGYVLNDEIMYFKIRNNRETIHLTFVNEKIKGNLLLVKKDKESNEPLANAQINVYDKNDKLIYEGITNEMGEIYLSNLPYGDYYVKEINAPTGYVLNDEIMYFKIRNNRETIHLTFVNEKIKGNLLLVKKDKETNERLNNTLMQIFDENDNLIYEEYTDNNGQIMLENLKYGKYYILEKQPKEGYLLSNEKIYFEIKKNKEIIEIEIENEKIPIVKEDFIVPNTYSNYNLIYILIPIFILLFGIIIYEKKEKY